MEGLLHTLLQMDELREMAEDIEKGKTPLQVTGLAPVHRAQAAAALSRSAGRPLLMVCADEKECQRMAGDLQALLDTEPVILPGREIQLRPTAAASRQWEYRRLDALYRLASGTQQLVLTTPDALVQRSIPPQILRRCTLSLSVGQQYDLSELVRSLIAAGYSRCDMVEGPGQFALRGGILDVFSPGSEHAVRCEFFDDEIDAMGAFDTLTQRRIHNCDNALLLPAGEVLPYHSDDSAENAAEKLDAAAAKLSRRKGTETLCRNLRADAEALRRGAAGHDQRYLAAVYDQRTCALDYLSPDTLICLSESPRIGEALHGWLWQLKEDMGYAVEDGVLAGELADPAFTEEELTERLAAFPVVQMESLPSSRYLLKPRSLLHINAKQLSGYGGSLDTAVTDLTHYLTAGYAVLVLCGGKVRATNLQEMLQTHQISAALALDGKAMPERNQVFLSLGALSAGSEFPALKLAVLTEGQLTAPAAGKRASSRREKVDSRRKLQSYADLSPGDLVVHAHHGIGRFVGMIRMPVDGVEKDYIKIAYAGSDQLYVPATSLDLVSKYVGANDDTERTKLNRLGGGEWTRTKRKAKAAAEDLAKGLIQLYAQRQRQPGFAFSPDSPWQQEFEADFDYTETDDQLRSIAEIKADMERPTPMDRLLCGDVGYGKTEVALRAVMKCILDGKQAAILVPTTVLAQQHYATAVNRFRSFPVTVEVLSRFRTPKQVKDVLERTKAGRVDLLIGTHKLLQKDLQFKDLGLLVIDEEQRFGVKHKEALREKARQVDTLTLSATPIPRTLNMAMSGIRDMSILEEPPLDRQCVQTYVLEHDWTVVGEAMRRELARGGQVYYLHNRVDNIESAAGRVRAQLDESAVVATAHGKMSERDLSRVMQQMADGEIDVLVCTTIIETGIDIPNVNTLIIEDADHLGLAQLHQIRGRIGRSPRRAYAYLTYHAGKVLTEVATKRLSAIREYVDFGAGFRIARRDLEIRGAGNLLGPEQSGYMLSVGYDMYLQLLADAVLEQQGKTPQRRTDCSADLTVSAHIPERYVPSAEQRMDLYRRIAAIRTAADADELLDELLDRFGDVPRTVQALLDVALLRAAAARENICDITQRGTQVVFTLTDAVDVPSVMAICSQNTWRQRLLLNAGETPKLTLRLRSGENALEQSVKLVEDLTLKRRQLSGEDAGE